VCGGTGRVGTVCDDIYIYIYNIYSGFLVDSAD